MSYNKPGESILHCGQKIVRRYNGGWKIIQCDFALSLEPIKIDEVHRNKPIQKVSPVERSALRSDNGKVMWLVMDSFDLAGQQLLSYNQLVNDAKKDEISLNFLPMNLDNRNDVFMTNYGETVSSMSSRSYHIKRKVRSTVAAEPMAALEAIAEADISRGHFADWYDPLDICGDYQSQLDTIKVLHLTGCKSLLV